MYSTSKKLCIRLTLYVHLSWFSFGRFIHNFHVPHLHWGNCASIIWIHMNRWYNQNRPRYITAISLIARFMGPTWGSSGADRTQMGPMLAPWTLLSGIFMFKTPKTGALLVMVFCYYFPPLSWFIFRYVWYMKYLFEKGVILKLLKFEIIPYPTSLVNRLN